MISRKPKGMHWKRYNRLRKLETSMQSRNRRWYLAISCKSMYLT